MVSPRPAAGLFRSPLEFKFMFHAFGGAESTELVVVTYLKRPRNQRHPAPHALSSPPMGIEIDHAELPAGEHPFWVELKDKSGRVGAAEFNVQVAK